MVLLGGCLAAVAYAAGGPHAGERSARPSAAAAPHARRAPARLPAVRITAHPQATSTVPTARFAFRVRGAKRRFECRLDSGPWMSCAAPIVYRGLAVGSHAFLVRVREGRKHGRASAYRWTLLEPKPFSIEPHLGGLPELFPGAGSVALPVTLTNPNPVPILVTAIRVALSAVPPGCEGASNFELLPSSASAASPVLIPAGGTVDLPSATASAPAIGMRELPFSQDACQGAELPLLFSGEAHG